MSFITDDIAAIYSAKVDAQAKPDATPSNQWWSAADATQVRAALLDTRSYLRAVPLYAESIAAHGADPGGDVDFSEALTEAVTTAIAKGHGKVYIPEGNYLLNHNGTQSGRKYGVRIDNVDHLEIIGSGYASTIVYDPTQYYAILFETGARNVHISGVTFKATNEEEDQNVNNKSATYFVSSWGDVTIDLCIFEWCNAVSTGADANTTGRFIFTNNRVFDGTAGVSGVMFSIITGNFFINRERTDSRSHPIYLYGPATDCIIANNVFVNNDQNGIQIRAGTARWRTKHGFIITGNFFDRSQNGIWIGSDEDTNTGSFLVTGNMFKNTLSAVVAQGCPGAIVQNNRWFSTWEFGEIGTATAVYTALAGGPNQPGHTNDAHGVVFKNNVAHIQHPFFGIIDLKADELPLDGDTITIGSTVYQPNYLQTYTWREDPTMEGDIQIGANIQQCVSNLAYELVGRGATAMCRVLRGEYDVIYSPYAYGFVGGDAAPLNRLVIASGHTFTIATSNSTRLNRTQVRDNRFPWYPLSATWLHDSVLSDNYFFDFGNGGGMQIMDCINPTVERNVLPGSAMTALGNIGSTYTGNRFPRTENTPQNANRQMRIHDFNSVQRDNDVLTEQEASSNILNGAFGIVGVGDGRATTLLWYGHETPGSYNGEPQSLPWCWNDGDEVYFDNGSAMTHTFYFKRSSPNGTTEFNTADGLLALINASGTYTAAYVPYSDVGGTNNPKMCMIVKVAAVGTAGNSHRLWITRYRGPDRQGRRVCGQLMRRRDVSNVDNTIFIGGSATRIKTPVFSRIATDIGTVAVRGVDAAAYALTPRVYRDDIFPGVGFLITHLEADDAFLGSHGDGAFAFDVRS